MDPYSFTHLSNDVVARNLHAAVRGNRGTTALELANIAEFDARKLYLPAAHPSMISYCVHVFLLTEGSARKRIHAARTARSYPQIFPAIADGRLNTSAVVMLAPYLARGDAAELLDAVASKTCTEIEAILAQRFPRADQPMLAPVADQSPDRGICEEPSDSAIAIDERAARRVQNETVPGSVPQAADSSGRSPWPVAVDPADHEKLRHAQSLLRHQIPSGDLSKVLSRLIELGLAQLEKRRRGAGPVPRRSGRRSANPRHVSSAVKFQVWERDGGRCTFTSQSGHRCPSRDYLEYDHVVPVARGGVATVENLRLRCRAHNQFEAEQTFGSEFMRHKREAERSGKSAEPPAMSPAVAEVIPWLRGLGFKKAEAIAAAASCDAIPDAPLESRVRHALRYFKQNPARTFVMSG